METRKLDRQVADIRAAGQPILPKDFASDPNNNAIVELIAAAKALNTDDQVWDSIDNHTLGLPLRPEETKSIQAIVKRSGVVFDHLQRSQQLQPGGWPINFSMQPLPLISATGDLNAFRSLSRMLVANALSEHQQGNDRGALQTIEQILFVDNLLQQHPTQIGHLVAIGCDALASQSLGEIACDLHIGQQPTDAPPQAVERIIKQLADDQPEWDGFVRSLQGERMFQLVAVHQMLNGGPVTMADFSVDPSSPWSPLARYAAKPIVYHNVRLIFDYESQLIHLQRTANFSVAKANMPAEIPWSMPLTAFAHIFTSGRERFVETQFRVLVDRHLAATSLAIRWYAVDHNGQLPPTLDALIPKYLPHVLIDTFAADSHPIRYLPRVANPIIYSVGQNGVDDSGNEDPLKPSAINYSPPGDWQSKDRTVHLTRQPRFIPPDESTQPSTMPIPN